MAARNFLISAVGLTPGCGGLIAEYESRAPKPGAWLMRGAQPATSAGARLFCRKPDSGALTILADGIEIKSESCILIRKI